MTGPGGDHIAIVTEVSPGIIRSMDSRETNDDTNGVLKLDINVSDPDKAVDKQAELNYEDLKPRVIDRLYRLKVIDAKA